MRLRYYIEDIIDLTTDLVVLALEVVVAELEAGEAAVVILGHRLQLSPGPGPIRDQYCDDQSETSIMAS